MSCRLSPLSPWSAPRLPLLHPPALQVPAHLGSPWSDLPPHHGQSGRRSEQALRRPPQPPMILRPAHGPSWHLPPFASARPAAPAPAPIPIAGKGSSSHRFLLRLAPPSSLLTPSVSSRFHFCKHPHFLSHPHSHPAANTHPLSSQSGLGRLVSTASTGQFTGSRTGVMLASLLPPPQGQQPGSCPPCPRAWTRAFSEQALNQRCLFNRTRFLLKHSVLTTVGGQGAGPSW